MLTQSTLIGIPRVINPNNPVDVKYVLDCFKKYCNITDKEFASYEKVANQIPGLQAHVPETYAPTWA
jgi:hypothetical protein